MRAGRGDRHAASVLVLRHSDRVMAVCYRMLGERSAAEDATQEAFMRFWKAAATWRPQGAQFRTWLMRIAMNLCLDRLRRSKREITDEDAPEMVDSAPRADSMLMTRETQQRVAEAVMRLPDRQRQAIILCHYEELSNIEAATVLDTTVEAVESLLGRARRRLRDELAPQRDGLMEGAAS